VLGEPAYYSRFGFETDSKLRYDGAPPEYFMRLQLSDCTLPEGGVEYASAFSA
jgi:putative acetyltransferase